MINAWQKNIKIEDTLRHDADQYEQTTRENFDAQASLYITETRSNIWSCCNTDLTNDIEISLVHLTLVPALDPNRSCYSGPSNPLAGFDGKKV